MGEVTLEARAAELWARAERGEITYTDFLTPGEQAELLPLLRAKGIDHLPYGGYGQAERRRIFFLPSYFGALSEADRASLLAETYADCVLSLEIRGSGYRELSHRDFMGALLHLGVERDRIGDICTLDPHRAVLFCDSVMAAFFTESLTRVANDAVKVTPVTLPPDFDGGRQFLQMSDTVASPRADAVVAALCNLPREKAQALFREGRVEINYKAEARTDRTVEKGAVVVIRGYGKFIIRSLADQTRKGRYRLLADKYI